MRKPAPDQDAAAKWDRIYSQGGHDFAGAARVLIEFQHLLPPSGDALDAACGVGGNALLLARLGLRVHAWDISRTAIDQLAGRAAASGAILLTEQRDVATAPPAPGSFDVIVVSHFLDRGLVPHLRNALRPRGLLYYQTFLRESCSDRGPHNPDYRLGANELLRLFAGMHIIYYREEGRVGRNGEGFRDEAMLIAQRRES